MKVVHIYKDYCPPIYGGMEIHLANMCRRLDAFADVEALVCSRRLRSRVREVDGVVVTEVGEWGRFQSAPISPTFPLWLRRKKADILHFHLPNPTAVISYLIARPKAKVVVTYQSDIVRQAVALKVYKPFLDAFLKRAEVVFVSSPNYLEISPFLKAVAEKCIIRPLGIDPEDYRLPADDEAGIEALRDRYGGRFILFVGVLRYYKGLRYLVDAMPEIPCPLVIVGDGPERPTLERLVRERSLEERVFFAGRVSEKEKLRHLHACSVFVYPASERSEAFGIAMLEALACGKPAVSTRLGTGVEYVNLDGVTGLTVPPKDPSALAGAVCKLLEDSTLREKLGAAAKKRAVGEFSLDRTVECTLEVYRNLLSGAAYC